MTQVSLLPLLRHSLSVLEEIDLAQLLLERTCIEIVGSTIRWGMLYNFNTTFMVSQEAHNLMAHASRLSEALSLVLLHRPAFGGGRMCREAQLQHVSHFLGMLLAMYSRYVWKKPMFPCLYEGQSRLSWSRV